MFKALVRTRCSAHALLVPYSAVYVHCTYCRTIMLHIVFYIVLCMPGVNSNEKTEFEYKYVGGKLNRNSIMCLLFLEYLMLKAGLIQSDMDIFSSLRSKQSSRFFFLFKVIVRKLIVKSFASDLLF